MEFVSAGYPLSAAQLTKLRCWSRSRNPARKIATVISAETAVEVGTSTERIDRCHAAPLGEGRLGGSSPRFGHFDPNFNASQRQQLVSKIGNDELDVVFAFLLVKNVMAL